MANFVDRRVVLNPPADDRAMEEIMIRFPSTFGSNIIDIYRKFDGFLENTSDPLNQISIWDVNKILHHELNEGAASAERRSVVIGDFLVESDFISLMENNGVFMLYEKRKLASSAQEFFENMASGQYDFL